MMKKSNWVLLAVLFILHSPLTLANQPATKWGSPVAVEQLKPCQQFVRSCKPLKDWQAKTMTYTITLPVDFRPDRKYPIIFEWPGKGQTHPADVFLATYLVTGHVHVALKYPLGCDDGRPLGEPTPRYTKFIRRVYRDTVKNFNGDPNYLFIGGFSAGGFMSAGPAIRMLTDANMRDVLRGVVAIGCGWVGSERAARGLNIMICYSDDDVHNTKKLPSQLPELRRYAKNLTVKLHKGGGHRCENKFEGPDIRKFFAMNGPDREDFEKLYEFEQHLERNIYLEYIEPCYQIAKKHNSAYVFAWTLLDRMLAKVKRDIELAEKGQAVPMSVDKMREILNRYQQEEALPQPGYMRYHVRLVIGRNTMTFEGQETTWEQLPHLLAEVPERNYAVLELAGCSPEIVNVPGTRQTNENFERILSRVAKLSGEYGFEHLSLVGIHPLGSMGKTQRLCYKETGK